MNRQAEPASVRLMKIGSLLRQRLVILQNGRLSVILQDGYVIQMNISETSYTVKPIDQPSEFPGGRNRMNQNSQESIHRSLPEGLDEAIRIIKSISYGSVTLVIQDGKIVQIEKNEKVRLK